jgi:hypothetical protein
MEHFHFPASTLIYHLYFEYICLILNIYIYNYDVEFLCFAGFQLV